LKAAIAVTVAGKKGIAVIAVMNQNAAITASATCCAEMVVIVVKSAVKKGVNVADVAKVVAVVVASAVYIVCLNTVIYAGYCWRWWRKNRVTVMS
jgi:hypothetical protein